MDDAAGTLTADTNTVTMDMDVHVVQGQKKQEQHEQPMPREDEEGEEIDDDLLSEDQSGNVVADLLYDSSAGAAGAGAAAMGVIDHCEDKTRSAPSTSSSAAAPSSSSSISSTALTIAEATELLETAVALPVPDSNGSKEKRIKAVGKALVALEAAHAAEGVSEGTVRGLPLHQQASEVIAAWRATLTFGSDVDACSLRDDNWYAGTLLAVRDSSSTSPGKKTAAAGSSKSWEVKFKRFASSHNERFAQTGPELMRLYPLGSYTGPKPVSQRVLAEKRQLAQEARDREAARRLKEVSFVQPTLPSVVGTTRSGRAVRSVNATINSAGPVSKRAKKGDGKKKKQCAHGEEDEGGKKEGEKEEEAEREQQQGNHIDTGGNDQNDWVCGTCEEMERSEGDRLVLCDGLCKRSFHQSCLGLSSEEVEALETWLCDQCLEKEHTCFVCGDTGKDDGAVDGVHKCMKGSCGKFYHAHCVSQLPNTVVSKQQQEQLLQQHYDHQEGGKEEGAGEVKFKFICPMHVCDLCGKGRESGVNRRELYPCWMCPKAYHLNCIPPSCKYHEYLLLCPEHSEEMDLPRLPGWGEEEGEEEALVGDGRCRGMEGWEEKGERSEGWLSLVLCSLLPKGGRSCRPFRLPVGLFDEVNSKPRPYGQIPCLKYLCKMPTREPGPECQCVRECGEGCLNRMLHIECVGVGGGEHGGEEGKKDRYHNCNVGPACGNRAFKNKEYIKHQIFKEGGCGWGLKTLEDVRKGQLVFEYVGEVIDEELLEARLQEHAREHPNDHNMYIMELEKGFYLDARTKGNASRFINHACAPNCELQKWTVKGVTHIGIMAVCDIRAGTPLSYDYQFATNEEGKFACHCGAPTCRGTLAPKENLTEDEEMEALRTGSRTDRKKLLELCKKRERREMARKEQAEKESAKRRNLTSQYLPGDALLEIRAGPPARFFRFAKVRAGEGEEGREAEEGGEGGMDYLVEELVRVGMCSCSIVVVSDTGRPVAEQFFPLLNPCSPYSSICLYIYLCIYIYRIRRSF